MMGTDKEQTKPDEGRATADGKPPKKALEEWTNEELLDAVAGRVVRMRLAVPAIFFLESTKPLSFLGSQLLIFLQPFVQAFLTIRNYERFSQLMEDRENVERLIRRIEALDEETRAEEKRQRAEAKKKRAEAKRQRDGSP